MERNKLKFERIIPGVASLLIPGLGQIIKEEFIKAFMIWILLMLISYYTWKDVTMIIPILAYIWNVFDAYND